jgi:hypothetical protein
MRLAMLAATHRDGGTFGRARLAMRAGTMRREARRP